MPLDALSWRWDATADIRGGAGSTVGRSAGTATTLDLALTTKT